jgi:hypothetical protein
VNFRFDLGEPIGAGLELGSRAVSLLPRHLGVVQGLLPAAPFFIQRPHFPLLGPAGRRVLRDKLLEDVAGA